MLIGFIIAGAVTLGLIMWDSGKVVHLDNQDFNVTHKVNKDTK